VPTALTERPPDPLRLAAPPVDDVEARRARASIESRLFNGPARPVRVGRYQIQGRIGAGGMGVVYRAHDPELVRDVAVKLLNTDATSTKDPATARARLVREARAMARLAHPNVLHVYDVGTTDDGVFIAMELVEGKSLGSVCEGDRPPWRQILRYYVDAGRGLAAAHAAGVIHRDFKPENVLVGTDERVRVGDFGLAGGPAALERSTSQDSELDRDSGDLQVSGSLTRTGALLGTPKYMAPEQEAGGTASASSDQFSFCVALYEALYGRPPFAGSTVAEYRHEVRHGRVQDPPADSKVRGWIHTEIVRGLAVDPTERHPALDPLLDRLEEALVDPNVARRRRRRMRVLSLAVGLFALGGASALGLVIASDDDDEPVTVAAAPTTEPAPTPPAAGSTTAGSTTAGSTTAGEPPNAPIAARAATPSVAPRSTAIEPSSPDATATDSDLDPTPERAAATDPAPSPDAADPGADDAGSDRPRAAAKRGRDTCYFQQDTWKLLQRTRKTTRSVTGEDGRCYDCGEMPDYRRRQVSPSDCTHYRQCEAVPEDQCKG
jgi:serine/threonine protein kinase